MGQIARTVDHGHTYLIQVEDGCWRGAGEFNNKNFTTSGFDIKTG